MVFVKVIIPTSKMPLRYCTYKLSFLDVLENEDKVRTLPH